jgi:hypothetical protein
MEESNATPAAIPADAAETQTAQSNTETEQAQPQEPQEQPPADNDSDGNGTTFVWPPGKRCAPALPCPALPLLGW